MSNQTDSVASLRVAFVRVENAGRGRVAAAVAAIRARIQGRTDVEIHSGDTDPAGESDPTVADRRNHTRQSQ